MFGGARSEVVAPVAIAATFEAVNGWVMLHGGVPLADAEDGLLPAFLRQSAPQEQDSLVIDGRSQRSRRALVELHHALVAAFGGGAAGASLAPSVDVL